MPTPDLRALARHPDVPGPAERARLRTLARLLVARGAPDLGAALEAATLLLESAHQPGGRLARGRLLSMARSLIEQLADPVEALEAAWSARVEEREEPAAALPPERDGARPAPPPASPPAASPPPAAPRRTAPQRPLGGILIELGHATEEEIEAALEVQRAKGLRLGECLLLLGAVSPERILAALRLQGEERDPASAAARRAIPAKPPEPAAPVPFRVTDEIFLGEVALGLEMITNEELEQAMHAHHHEDVPVGEALVRLGFLSEEQLAQALEFQRNLRDVARLAPLGGRLTLHVPERGEARA